MHNFVVIAIKRRIQSLRHICAVFAACPNNNSIGFHEITDDRAFFEKFRIGDDVEGERHATLCKRPGNRLANLIRGTHRTVDLSTITLG